jgi:photosystem II 13kDa protein
MAEMQFARGKTETVVPDVRLTKARDGQSGTAIFYFDKPEALCNNDTAEVTGLYMLDEEGELITREVKAKFVNGQPAALEVILKLQSPAEWDRFMRFMNRYAETNGLGFSKSAEEPPAET